MNYHGWLTFYLVINESQSRQQKMHTNTNQPTPISIKTNGQTYKQMQVHIYTHTYVYTSNNIYTSNDMYIAEIQMQMLEIK